MKSAANTFLTKRANQQQALLSTKFFHCPITMATVDTSNIKINIVPSETELHDVMNGAARWDVTIHEHGRWVYWGIRVWY